jgi:hypothetical protein
VQHCQVCGRSFDPLSFQVVVPELARGFDRIECARSARLLAGPGSRVAATPLMAIAEPLSAALVPAAAGRSPALRTLSSSAATLGLLGAGTAAAVVLWLRVLGADPSSFTLGRLPAPAAFGHETVQAHVEAAPARTLPVERRAPSQARPVTAVNVATAPGAPAFTPLPDKPPGTAGGQTPGTPEPSSPPSASPPTSSPPIPARPSTSSPASEPTEITGKGHAKHGKGHYKHGETDGVHSPGHGHGKPEGKAHGQGTEKAKGKKH